MATRVRWFGHSALLIEGDGSKILIDPFFTGNPTATVSADDVQADAILVSHGHEDHLGDAIAIARRTGAPIITNFEIGNWLTDQGLTSVHGMQHGGGITLDGGVHVKLTIAFHGSTLPGGGYGGNPCGFLVTMPGGSKIYDAADTALFGDMRLIGDEGLELAMLPIGDYYTMGPDDALRAVEFLRPKKVLPIHYDTFPPIKQDAARWADRVRSQGKAEPVVIKPGDWFEID